MAANINMEKIVSLCKRRGFVFPSSEIYGGLGSCWDYGPMGVELKRNVRDAWWKAIVQERDDVVGIDSSIMMHPDVWKASGHIDSFTDPLVECKRCHSRFRLDEIAGSTRKLLHSLDKPISWFSSSGDQLFVQGLTIDAPSSAITLKQAELTSSGRLNQSLSKEILLEAVKPASKKYPLFVGSQLYPGGKGYVVGFKVVEGRLGASIKLVFDDIHGIFEPVEIVVDFANMQVTQTVPKHYCPSCGGELTEPRMFNLMFKTFMGPVEEEASTVYLRPETAQGMFVNFENVVTTTRKKLPLGIAQIGKSFRNEITPGNFIFRTREFEHMELEYFVKPGTDEAWFDYWVKERFEWYIKLGMKKENLRLCQHGKDELAHYAKDCYDIEYLFPMGWSELEGIANRSDYDLTQHAKHSGKDLSYFDGESGERYIPYVIEPSAGVDRTVLALLIDAYSEEEVEGEKRAVLHLQPSLAPMKVAVLPLSRNEKLAPLSKEVYKQLCPNFMTCYDDSQSIGRRYRRQDEIGTPFCVTIDFESLEDNQATIRDRDSLAQIRVPVEELERTLRAKLNGEPFEKTPLWATRQK